MRFLLAVVISAASIGVAHQHHPHHQHYPAWWIQQAKCVHYWEADRRSDHNYNLAWSENWHIHYQYGTTIESSNKGGLQIGSIWSAYAKKGWTMDPAHASKWQQIYVAFQIWLHNGRRWGGNQWPADSLLCHIP